MERVWAMVVVSRTACFDERTLNPAMFIHCTVLRRMRIVSGLDGGDRSAETFSSRVDDIDAWEYCCWARAGRRAAAKRDCCFILYYEEHSMNLYEAQ